MSDLEMGYVDCHSDLLSSGKISQKRSAGLDCGVTGAAEMKGGGGRVVRLYITFPLQLGVAQRQSLLEWPVGGDPSRDGCRGSIL